MAAVDGTASASVVSSAAADTGAGEFRLEFMFYLEMDDGIATDGEVNAVVDEVMATEGLPCEVIPSTSSDSSVTSMAGRALHHPHRRRPGPNLPSCPRSRGACRRVGGLHRDPRPAPRTPIAAQARHHRGRPHPRGLDGGPSCTEYLAGALSHAGGRFQHPPDGRDWAQVTIVDETHPSPTENILDER